MNIEEKRKIYLERFPGPLGRRMSEQCDDDDVNKIWPELELLWAFAVWDKTEEGDSFWSDIKNLFYRGTPTESEIKAVFERHNIEYR